MAEAVNAAWIGRFHELVLLEAGVPMGLVLAGTVSVEVDGSDPQARITWKGATKLDVETTWTLYNRARREIEGQETDL